MDGQNNCNILSQNISISQSFIYSIFSQLILLEVVEKYTHIFSVSVTWNLFKFRAKLINIFFQKDKMKDYCWLFCFCRDKSLSVFRMRVKCLKWSSLPTHQFSLETRKSSRAKLSLCNTLWRQWSRCQQ